jgi:cation transport ATPase
MSEPNVSEPSERNERSGKLSGELAGDHLLALEPEEPALRAEYERRLNMMLEIPLSPVRRTGTVVVMVAAAAMAVLFAALLATESVPWKTRSAFVVGLLFAAAWVAYAVRILRRGKFHRRTDSTAAANMAWAFSVVTAVAFALLTPHKDPFVIFGFLFVLPAAVILLRTVTEQSELRTQERLLELEYKLARLTEMLEKKGAGLTSGK